MSPPLTMQVERQFKNSSAGEFVRASASPKADTPLEPCAPLSIAVVSIAMGGRRRCSLLTTHYSPLTSHYSLLTTHCSLLTRWEKELLAKLEGPAVPTK